VDTVSKSVRSRMMASVGQSRTKPERVVARFLRLNGIKFRRNLKTLPGSPDLVLAEKRTVVFVHGCFWHGHKNCRSARRPSTNVEYWMRKIDDNIRRDNRKTRQLRQMGWHVITIWQCRLGSRAVESTLNRLALRVITNV
jgi:DNA mismatch endonuclease, patch repair protein